MRGPWSLPAYRSSKAGTFVWTIPNRSVTAGDAAIDPGERTALRIAGEVSMVTRDRLLPTMIRVWPSQPSTERRQGR